MKKSTIVNTVLITSALACFLASNARAQETTRPVVNVNEATVEQLAFLPGIGPAKADNVLYAREQGFTFKSAPDLTRVSGIGPKTVEKLRDYVVFEGPTTATSKLGSTAKNAGGNKFKRPSDEDSKP